MFRPSNNGDQDCLLYMRKINHYIPEASESPQGEFWRKVLEKKHDNVTWEEFERTLPYHDTYVYSAEFLASVMVLVYEVL